MNEPHIINLPFFPFFPLHLYFIPSQTIAFHFLVSFHFSYFTLTFFSSSPLLQKSAFIFFLFNESCLKSCQKNHLTDEITTLLKHSILDENNHQIFHSLAHVLSYSEEFRECLSYIHSMSHPLSTPIFLESADARSNLNELITADFLSELPHAFHTSSPTNYPTPSELTATISEALSEAGFDESEIKEVTRPITDANSVKRFLLSGSEANSIARSNAFPDFIFLEALLDDKSLFNNKSKSYEIPLSPEYLLSLIETNPSLRQDHLTDIFDKQLVDFLTTNRNHFSSNPTSSKERRLLEIRKTVSKNIRDILATKPRVLSLKKYSNQPVFPTRNLTAKTVKTLAKQCVTSTKRAPAIPTPSSINTLNCFR